MSYDSKLEGMAALAIGMSSGSAPEGFKTVQKDEQSRVRNSRELPRDMRPSQEAFEALGFTFTDIGDVVLFDATLPEGWSTQEDSSSDILWENLVDDKGRVRGNYFYKGSAYDRCGEMTLFNRFEVTYQKTDPDKPDGPGNVVVTDADGSVIFNAGKCKYYFSKEYDQLFEIAEEYLESNYPEWKDPTKYWD